MAVNSYPEANGGKNRYAVTLTSGTSYTVPTGVTYLNVTLVGGAGGGSGGFAVGADSSWGMPGAVVSSTLAATAGASITYAIGAGGTAGAITPTAGGTGGTTTFTGATSATGGAGGNIQGQNGGVGSVGNMNTGGMAGIGNGSVGRLGGVGGAGFIIVEYWA